MKKIHEKVYFILESDLATRNSDKLLYVRYLGVYHPKAVRYSEKHDKHYLDVDYLSSVPIQTISRCRRMIQNTQNKFLPTSAAVRKERRIKEHMFRSYSQEGQLEVSHP